LDPVVAALEGTVVAMAGTPNSSEPDSVHAVPPTIRWRRSSASAHNGNCVEVAGLPDSRFAVRDSKDTSQGCPILIFAGAEWGNFLEGVKAGEFNFS
jgi:hypothetical protein